MHSTLAQSIARYRKVSAQSIPSKGIAEQSKIANDDPRLDLKTRFLSFILPGTFAVVSLMTSGIVQSVGTEIYVRQNASAYYSSNHADSVMDLKDIPLDIRVQVTVAVTLAVGIWQVNCQSLFRRNLNIFT